MGKYSSRYTLWEITIHLKDADSESVSEYTVVSTGKWTPANRPMLECLALDIGRCVSAVDALASPFGGDWRSVFVKG